jgi:hypothetical protein
MGLGVVVEALATHLRAALPAPVPSVGAAAPGAVGDLPAVTLSVEGATSARPGMGKVPGPVVTGALRVETSVNLAAPTVHFGDDDVTLLSADRLTLQIPHGSVVRADGFPDQPFASADLTVRLGATTFTPVAGAPAAGQVQIEPASGLLRFASALPAAGAVELGYFVGAWEVRAERFQGQLLVDVAAGDASATLTLSQAVEGALALDRIPVGAGVRTLDPVELGPVAPIAVLPGEPRTRRLAYRFDVEHVEPLIQTGGGPIRVIDVAATFGPESFTVPTEGISP